MHMQCTWEACGLNVGYWSVDNEAWFQKCLENIHNYDGTDKPPYHSAIDWHNKLRYHKVTTKKVVASARKVAERWLLNNL
jgi:hypothetical protein